MNDGVSGLRVIGSYSPSECARKLRELDDEKTAREFDDLAIDQAGGRGLGFFGIKKRQLRPWQHVSHNFGFIASQPGETQLDVVPAGSIESKASMVGTRVTITLNRLFVAEYPGSGEHRVLFTFAAVNYLGNNAVGEKIEEPLQFNMTVRARNGEHAAIIGWPIFRGLTVGPDGIAFECSTINVKNHDDERLLSFIDSDVFRKGLDLLTVVQPAMKPLVAISSGLMHAFGERNRNVAVQSFSMGLDCGNNLLGARLAEGDYVALQAPTDKWNWPDVVYDRTRGQLVARNNQIPINSHNYLVFGVTRKQ